MLQRPLRWLPLILTTLQYYKPPTTCIWPHTRMTVSFPVAAVEAATQEQEESGSHLHCGHGSSKCQFT